MNKYTIYCTEEQTRKALKLGAPIISYHNAFTTNDIPHYTIEEGNGNCTLYIIPTAEQMFGWLEDRCISVKAVCFSWCYENKPTWQIHAYNEPTDFWDEVAFGHSKSCKEATLAAIDAALDYLSKNK